MPYGSRALSTYGSSFVDDVYGRSYLDDVYGRSYGYYGSSLSAYNNYDRYAGLGYGRYGGWGCALQRSYFCMLISACPVSATNLWLLLPRPTISRYEGPAIPVNKYPMEDRYRGVSRFC